jgi:CubicO group peptidase (beta-lactamase class C family)
MDGLHVFEGVDYSSQITVEQLLSHNSGLPDYFQAIRKSNSSLMEQIFKGEDQKWDLRQVLKDAKELGAVFPPSFKNKALYSDTNFQILGAIVESILGDSLSNCIDKYICKKINLTKTYLYTDETDSRPVSLNYKKKPLNIPLAMTSFGPDGGIVSTASDGIAFLKGFF